MVIAKLAVGRSYGVRTPNCYKDFAEEAVVEMKILVKNLVNKCRATPGTERQQVWCVFLGRRIASGGEWMTERVISTQLQNAPIP